MLTYAGESKLPIPSVEVLQLGLLLWTIDLLVRSYHYYINIQIYIPIVWVGDNRTKRRESGRVEECERVTEAEFTKL